MEFLTKISVRNSFRSQAKKYYTNIENKYKFEEIEYEKEEEDTFWGDLERKKEKFGEVTVKGRNRSRKGTKDRLRDEIKTKEKR